MTGELPFSITFALPDGWTLVPPESCGQPDAAYVAVREKRDAHPITTNIVISGFGVHNAHVDVAALADQYRSTLGSRYPVTLLNRNVTAGAAAPEAAQLLQIDYPAGESSVAVNQVQIINAFPDTQDPGAVAVLQLLMTCPADIFDQAGPEFRRFVASISSPVTPAPQT
jgi:hypothetical protein